MLKNKKMTTKYIIKYVSETHNLNNPHEKTASGCFDSEAENTRTQCGGEEKLPEKQRLGDTRPLLK
jgi:hypothetical protein